MTTNLRTFNGCMTPCYLSIIFCRLGANSPQQGPSASDPSSPSQLRNRGGAEPSSSIFVAGGVSYSVESLDCGLILFRDFCSSAKRRTYLQRCPRFLLAVTLHLSQQEGMRRA
jgi:hypothetical protein